MSHRTLLVGVGRQTGKTTKLIGLADAFGATIVTPKKEMANCVTQMARRMGSEVSVVSLSMHDVGKLREGGKPILVDDADLILEDILGVPISALTFDGKAFDSRWTV